MEERNETTDEMREAGEERITVVMVEPGKKAETVEIGTTLYDLQQAVGGWIQTFYPFEDPDTCIVCNDEGKLLGMTANRAVYTKEGEIADVMCGPFFICDCSTENFGSLDDTRREKYLNEFLYPEHFFRVGRELISIPYDPLTQEAVRSGPERER